MNGIKSHTLFIIGFAEGWVIGMVLIVSILCFFYLRKQPKKKQLKGKDLEENKPANREGRIKDIKISLVENSSFSEMRLRDLMVVTNNFSQDNFIGSGRTGAVYKGMLPNGFFIAVKKFQGSQLSLLEREFASEFRTLGSLRHRNLVPLLGYCISSTTTERFLVYKYMLNGNLHDLLHLDEDKAKFLEWPKRLRIGIGLARGLAWLHYKCNTRIVHRNISSKCILLDENFEPRISNFILSMQMNLDVTHLNTIVNVEFGELGCVAPEYMQKLVATPKGDVYSFGVVLLELVTRIKPTKFLVEWMIYLFNNSSGLYNARLHIDKSLVGKDFDMEIFQFLKVACNCLLPSPNERPTMLEVYRTLRAIEEDTTFVDDNEILMQPDIVSVNVGEEITEDEIMDEFQ